MHLTELMQNGMRKFILGKLDFTELQDFLILVISNQLKYRAALEDQKIVKKALGMLMSIHFCQNPEESGGQNSTEHLESLML